MLGHTKIFEELTHLADKDELKHGYIFFGPDGVGKKVLALRLAKHLEFGALEEEKVLSDTTLIVPFENSLGIDAVRTIRGFLYQKPNQSKKRTVIIDSGELLTEEAGNALLKIAEEPPPSALIILIVHDPEEVGATLASRFEKIYFGPVKTKDIEEWLMMQKKVSKDEAKKTAEASFGRPALALAILESEELEEMQKKVQKFIGAKPATLKPTLKALLEDEEFSLKKFLDALILNLAWKENRNLALWHKVLELRHTAEFFGLNPRIQLENIWKNISKN